MVEDLKGTGAEHITVNIRTKFFLSWRVFAAVPEIKKVIRENKITIIHAHTRVTHFLAYVVSRLTAVPYVITYHGFYHIKPIRRIFPCLGDRVISISDQVSMHLLEEFHVAPHHMATIRNGIDLKMFKPVSREKSVQKREEFSCRGKRVVGIIARLADVKGHCFLIDAINMVRQTIPDVMLLIVGTGKEEQRLRDQVRRLKLEQHVLFYPTVNQSADLLGIFDCFVLPSLEEGLGLSIMEAQAAGLPVIASRVGGIPSLIEDGETGLLVNPGSAEELSEAIRRILGDSALAASLGAHAYNKAQREYGADMMAEKIIKVYQETCRQQVTGDE